MKNIFKVLGAFGGKTKETSLSSFLINSKLVIDAGNLLYPLSQQELLKIKDIFITHSHFDHISDLALLIDNTYSNRSETLNIYGTVETINNIKNHIFNNNIWPNFSNIKLPDSNQNAITFHIINYNTPILIDNMIIEAIENTHIAGSCGYIIKSKEKSSLCISSDTYISAALIDKLNSTNNISKLIIEVSFPSKYAKLAKSSNHLTPDLLEKLLNEIHDKEIKIYINHMKPEFIDEIKSDLSKINFCHSYEILEDNSILHF
jgi:ribonuclease BN (tRNA processing enzyme)